MNIFGDKMKNRAKCKLCSCIIESFHSTDWIVCKCEEIAVGGGDALQCAAKDWDNFLRIDEEGNEIVPKVLSIETDSISNNSNEKNEDSTKENTIQDHALPNKKELLDMLLEMIKNIENLPQHVMSSPITHYDFCSLLILLSALFRTDSCSDEI